MQSTGQQLVHIKKLSSEKTPLNFNWILNFALHVSSKFFNFCTKRIIYIKPKLRKNPIRFYN